MITFALVVMVLVAANLVRPAAQPRLASAAGAGVMRGVAVTSGILLAMAVPVVL